MLRRAAIVLLVACATVALTSPKAQAQARGGAEEPDIAIRAVVEAGARTFSAAQSFDAVLGSNSGAIFGAGAAAIIRRNVFVSFDVTRFQRDGERVVVAAGEAFPNGIPTTISVVPMEISAGWRFTQNRRTVIPYLGGGLGWHKYKETSDFADDGEDVEFTKIGFQLLGGAEWRASRWLGIAGEAAWMSVPDAFSNDTGAAAAFDEHDLGGAVFRVKVVIGR